MYEWDIPELPASVEAWRSPRAVNRGRVVRLVLAKAGTAWEHTRENGEAAKRYMREQDLCRGIEGKLQFGSDADWTTRSVSLT